ncbi:PREDICTED: uncharacterized protein LOC105969320 [Erythranthe guttata]|uniref:uncharacterized protein LOC105969320 n=1 Tax=Erythranthe guttata TaxID=4155 RepID=UPI00064D8B90|nr:PREDICTED: uncharacterized protein LOC105969320 [Erythranthe guttata]|eukprot:XP_012849530.1 PREDICTED: uncharacterized protein LOC105969320 [Erythranthe guttata]
MWKLWDNRNRELHGQREVPIGEIASWSATFLDAYSQAKLLDERNRHSNNVINWNPPMPGVIKINVDVAFSPNKDYNGVSMVARDHRGSCIWWKVKKMEGRSNVVDGEAYAVLHAIRVAQEKQWSSIVIEGDNLTIIESLRQGEPSTSSFGALMDESFVKRSGNKLAHDLVKNIELLGCERFSLPLEFASE